MGEDRKHEAYKEKAAFARAEVQRMIRRTSEGEKAEEVRSLFPRPSFIGKLLRMYQAKRGSAPIPKHERNIHLLGPTYFEQGCKTGRYDPPPGSYLLTGIRLHLHSYFSHTICASVAPMWHSGKMSFQLKYLRTNAVRRVPPAVLLLDMLSLDEETCSVPHGHLCSCQNCFLLRQNDPFTPDMVGQWGCLERRDIFQMELFKVGNLPQNEDLKAFIQGWLEGTASGRALLHPDRLPRVLRGSLEVFGRIQLGSSMYIRLKNELHATIPLRVVLAPPEGTAAPAIGSQSLCLQLYDQIRRPYRLFLRRLQLRLYMLQHSYEDRVLVNFNQQVYNLLPLLRERKRKHPRQPVAPLSKEDEELDISTDDSGESENNTDTIPRQMAEDFCSSFPHAPISISLPWYGIKEEETVRADGESPSPTEDITDSQNSVYQDSDESESLGEKWEDFRWLTTNEIRRRRRRPRIESDSSTSSSTSSSSEATTVSSSILWEQQVEEAEAELSPMLSD